eukprot:4985326-Prymnesium_polylepis.1
MIEAGALASRLRAPLDKIATDAQQYKGVLKRLAAAVIDTLPELTKDKAQWLEPFLIEVAMEALDGLAENVLGVVRGDALDDGAWEEPPPPQSPSAGKARRPPRPSKPKEPELTWEEKLKLRKEREEARLAALKAAGKD